MSANEQELIERITFECTKRISVKHSPSFDEVIKKMMRGEHA